MVTKLHTMGAFFSGTDDANENATQFYGVFGMITQSSPAFIFRHVCGKDKIVCDKSVLFDVPTTKVLKRIEIEGQVFESEAGEETYSGPWPTLEYPEDWMGQHVAEVYVAPAYTGGAYGGRGAYIGYEDEYGYGNYGRGGTQATQGGAKKITGLGSSTNQSHAGSTGASAANGEIATRTVSFGQSEIEITAHAGASGFALDEVENLLKVICETGYDQQIIQAVQEARQDFRGV